jgi:hypothetical protein
MKHTDERKFKCLEEGCVEMFKTKKLLEAHQESVSCAPASAAADRLLTTRTVGAQSGCLTAAVRVPILREET